MLYYVGSSEICKYCACIQYYIDISVSLYIELSTGIDMYLAIYLYYVFAMLHPSTTIFYWSTHQYDCVVDPSTDKWLAGAKLLLTVWFLCFPDGRCFCMFKKINLKTRFEWCRVNSPTTWAVYRVEILLLNWKQIHSIYTDRFKVLFGAMKWLFEKTTWNLFYRVFAWIRQTTSQNVH